MHFVLQRTRQKCFVIALVRQAWGEAHGGAPELIIGVKRGSGEFQAHAWLDGDAPGSYEGFSELVRWRYGQTVQAPDRPLEWC